MGKSLEELNGEEVSKKHTSIEKEIVGVPAESYA
jgi:hypothetical protein